MFSLLFNLLKEVRECDTKVRLDQVPGGGAVPILVSCPRYLFSKLKAQNNAARLIFRTSRSTPVTAMLHSLHWLPIEQRIWYKLTFFCIEIISHQAFLYLSDLLHLYTPSQQLCFSADIRVLRIPSYCIKSSGQHSFSHPVPATGTNSLFMSSMLPLSVLFEPALKTFL